MNIGFLGGTFNPIQNAHIELAISAKQELGLDQVVFVPIGKIDHKAANDPGPEIRFFLTEMAVKPFGFEVSRQQTDSALPSYTINHLDALKAAYPADQHYWIVGGDQAVSFPKWHSARELISKAKLAVAERDDFDRTAIFKSLGDFGILDQVEFFAMPSSPVSSTMVRTLLQTGQSARTLVPIPVHDWITDHLIYA